MMSMRAFAVGLLAVAAAGKVRAGVPATEYNFDITTDHDCGTDGTMAPTTNIDELKVSCISITPLVCAYSIEKAPSMATPPRLEMVGNTQTAPITFLARSASGRMAHVSTPTQSSPEVSPEHLCFS